MWGQLSNLLKCEKSELLVLFCHICSVVLKYNISFLLKFHRLHAFNFYFLNVQRDNIRGNFQQFFHALKLSEPYSKSSKKLNVFYYQRHSQQARIPSFWKESWLISIGIFIYCICRVLSDCLAAASADRRHCSDFPDSISQGIFCVTLYWEPVS